MPKFKLIALTKPNAGCEDEYNVWYQNVHLPEVCALPGIQGAQRFKQAAVLQNGDEHNYLAVYDIETDDIGATLASFGQAVASGEITQSDSSDSAGSYAVIFSEFG